MTAPGLYVYGIVRAGHPLPEGCRGVGSPPAPVRLLASGRLAAVVGDAPPGLRARRRDLAAHQELLLALAEDGPVLPMRFGMVCADAEALAGLLSAAEPGHLAALERVEGRLEMNLKGRPVEDFLSGLVRDDPRLRRLRDTARRHPGYETNIRLGEAVAAAVERRAAAAAAGVLRELSALADATAPGPKTAGHVLNTSFLVPRSGHDRFAAAAARLAADHRTRVELRLTGPMPCYSFTAPGPVPAGA